MAAGAGDGPFGGCGRRGGLATLRCPQERRDGGGMGSEHRRPTRRRDRNRSMAAGAGDGPFGGCGRRGGGVAPPWPPERRDAGGGGGPPPDRPRRGRGAGLFGVAAVAAGGYHTVALKSDGTVWAWGYNGEGELGDGSTTNRSVPVQVTGLSGVAAVAADGYHTVSLKSDGTVWAWGSNGSGQLGDGTTVDRWQPGQVTGLS